MLIYPSLSQLQLLNLDLSWVMLVCYILEMKKLVLIHLLLVMCVSNVYVFLTCSCHSAFRHCCLVSPPPLLFNLSKYGTKKQVG